jgi:hypothetical protein
VITHLGFTILFGQNRLDLLVVGGKFAQQSRAKVLGV